MTIASASCDLQVSSMATAREPLSTVTHRLFVFGLAMDLTDSRESRLETQSRVTRNFRVASLRDTDGTWIVKGECLPVTTEYFSLLITMYYS